MLARVLLFAPAVAAFMAPAAQKASNVAVHAKSKAIPFLEAPEGLDQYVGGEKGFDPLMISRSWPISFLREAELKHGRVCMLATVGWVVADMVKLPGEIHQVSSLQAHDVFVKSGAMTQILVAIACLEFVSYVAIKGMVFENSGRQPGDYAFDPLIFGKKDDPEWQLKEIENGRLAMLAFSGIVTQAALGHDTFPYV